MPDVFTKAKRSAVMSLIRGSGNRDTELRMMALFRAHGVTGWRRGALLTGRPDFVFRRERVAVFVDGCFWHGCPKHSPPARWLKKSSMRFAALSPRPLASFDKLRMTTTGKRTGKQFWRKKLAANKARDRLVN